MKELTKKYLYNLYKRVHESDSNDWIYYINLIEANIETVENLLNSNWRISNKLNSKTVLANNVHFEFINKKMKAYVYDGNGTKRYVPQFEHDFIDIEFPTNTEIENIGIAEKRMKELLPPTTELKSTNLTKSDLEDYSEKCYKLRADTIYLPKSQVGFDGDTVVLPIWLAKKYGF